MRGFTHIQRDEVVLQLRLVHRPVHLEELLHDLSDGRGDEDGGRLHPEHGSAGDVHGESSLPPPPPPPPWEVRRRTVRDLLPQPDAGTERLGEEGDYDVIHVSVRDEEEILGDRAMRTAADVEGDLQRGEHHTGLLPSYR